MIWSTGRADIPSTSFDAGRPVVFRFSSPTQLVAPPTQDATRPSELSLVTPTELHLPARLLHQDFATEIAISANTQFNVWVDHPLIDIPFVHDVKVEQTASPSREQAVRRSRARAHVTLLMVALWLTGASFALFVTGIALALGDSSLGAGIGIPGMLLLPVGLVLIAIAGVRRLVLRRRRNHPA